MGDIRHHEADAFVIFGLTGDLAYKMLIPALYAMEARKELSLPVIGVALTDLDLEGLRKRARDSLRDAHVSVDDAVFARLAKRLQLVAGSFDDQSTFDNLAKELGGAKFPVFYLAVPPSPVRDGRRRAGHAPGSPARPGWWWRSRSATT